ncbi:MAG: YbhB/YbcL family Raf kinase inhibitor-like protein [bacterium]
MKHQKLFSASVFPAFLFLILLLLACRESDSSSAVNKNEINKSTGGNMKITSPAFTEGTMIPARYTCDSINVSPQLEWTGAPQNTKTFTLICDDPDAPVGIWVHWVVFNIPGSVTSLPEGIEPKDILPDGSKHGKNDFGKLGYGGPCPPGGTHRYFFKLYALDTELNLKPGIKKADLEKAMQGHVLAESQLMGKYKR